jgi:MmgE/PrpD N-terminal domain
VTLTLEKPAIRAGQLAEFVADMRDRPLPDNVLAAIKTFVIDGTGALVAASNPDYPTGRLISDFVMALGGLPQASVVGRTFKTSVVMTVRQSSP